MNKNLNLLICVVLISALGFIVYANSLNGDFVWDDHFLVKSNLSIKSWQNIPKVFREDAGAGSAVKTNFYRPLQIVSYMLDYSLYGLKPRGYHLTSIILHILVALSVYWLANILFSSTLLSFIAGLLFVVHPLHSEAVAYIAGRADLLAGLFILLCLIFYIKQDNVKSKKLYIFMLSAYILALFSKEYGLITPILLVLYSFLFCKKIQAKNLLSLLGISGFYLILRLTILKFPFAQNLPRTTLLQRIPGFFVAITEYLRLLLLPFNLHMEYGNKLFFFYALQVILGFVVTLLLLIYAFIKRKNNILFAFSIFWFFLALLPNSNLYPLSYYMAEHWVYLASIGFFIILAQGLVALHKRKGIWCLGDFLILILIFYSYLTIKQNNYWKNEMSLFKYTWQNANDNPKACNNFCKACVDNGEYKKAIMLCKQAITLKENYEEPYYNLANAYLGIGDYLNAIKAFQKAIAINPGYPGVKNAKEKINEATVALGIIKEHSPF
ncbi:MAG: tetratricopeptide repeat protein [Candidatus Omnitrophota bacterium]